MNALVTGANKGIGKEVVRQLADKGYATILTARDETKGQRAVDELKSKGLDVRFMPLEVTNDDSIQKLAESLTLEGLKLDVLVNNAGIHYDTWNDAQSPDWNIVDEAWKVNFLGAWKVAVALLPMLRQTNNPRIVNVSSEAGAMTETRAGTPAYSASKAAMNMLTIKLAAELAPSGFKVNSVCPGWVRTDMGGSAAPRNVAEGAASVVWAATLDKDGPSGGFFRDGKLIEW